MSAQPPRRLSSSLVLSLPLAVAALWTSAAVAQDLDDTLRELENVAGEADQLNRTPIRRDQLRSATFVEERLTDGELFYRLEDYVRASVIFTDIVERHPTHRAYPDALFLLAESLFQAKDYLGARTRYSSILDRAAEARFKPFLQRSLGRLIEIANRTHDFEGVDAYFAALNRLPTSELEAATAYFRAKYLYGKAVGNAYDEHGDVQGAQVDQGLLEQARVAFEAVGERSPYHPHARYFVGVIFTLRNQYPQAIASFQRALLREPQDAGQREVQELAQLAVGRLHYEANQLQQATAAYQKIPRESARYDSSLYEIAWVYLRRGDTTRAEQALEMLSVAAPDSRYIPDGNLLRGNLLLRDGRFALSEKVFSDVAEQFTPVRDGLNALVASHEDPQAYFRDMVRGNLDVFDVGAFLPPQAMKWAALEGDMQRAMAALEDLSQARTLGEETENIVLRLDAALAIDNVANIFPDLRGYRERATSLRNRLSRIRRNLALIEEDRGGVGSPELTEVRNRRRELERQIGGMPVGERDFEKRRRAALSSFVALDKEVSRLEVQVLGLEAKVVATERFLQDTMSGRDAAGVAAVRSELATHREAIQEYRTQMKRLGNDIEAGRLRVGVGDKDFLRDEDLRKEHAALIERERSIIGRLGGRTDGRVDGALRRMAGIEQQLAGLEDRVEAVARERTVEMRRVLDEERVKLQGYRTQLTELEGSSEDVVGSVAYANFQRVQERFYNLVLRADVGVIDVAWARREEYRMRAEMLTRDRSRSLKALDDEYRDIIDEGEGE